jgi:hypothetical protein
MLNRITAQVDPYPDRKRSVFKVVALKRSPTRGRQIATRPILLGIHCIASFALGDVDRSAPRSVRIIRGAGEGRDRLEVARRRVAT